MAWMDLEGIMLSEMSQIEKDKYCMTSLICGILKIKNKTINKTITNFKYSKNVG